MKTFRYFAITLIAILVFKTSIANEPFVISGTWERAGNPTAVNLYQVTSGRLDRVSASVLQADRTFTLAFTPQSEGFFVVGTGSPLIRMDQYTFWMKPGDRLRIAVNDSSFTLVGENSLENVAMTAWHNFIQPLEWQSFYFQRGRTASTTYVEFFPLLEDRIRKPFVAKPTGNRRFDELFANYRQFDLMHCAINFVMTPRRAQPALESFPRFYRTLNIMDFDNTDMFIFPYRIWTNILHIQNRFTQEHPSDKNLNLVLMDILTNDTVKGEVFLSMLSGVRELPAMQELNRQFAKYVVTDDQRRRFDREIERVNTLHLEQGVGSPGLDFTYQDVNGNPVSFSDFRGRVVYLNVWATWCAPCRAEIPHKKKIEEHFSGNENIVFVNVSLDNLRDLQRWRDFVATHQLGGVQLHGNIDGPMNFRTLYGIMGIPRFMIFDKRGNIVSTDAPRPSSPEILPLLVRLLEQV